MTVTKTLEEKVLNVKVEGRLDTATAPALEEELAEVMDEAEELVFDLEGLEYMSSAGLRILLATQKKMAQKGGMKVVNVNDVIKEIFDITGFSDILTIE
ncbi:MAG: STAS domain-containing protein [Firmicutes bacterium]|jgi:anti-sigma B factor antagonist|nr:STAS domain-containing protein [Clostridiales bacterium]MBQ6088981.1 STAS domain-containing protein [Bacillota bacterium]MBQ6608636.1 STAS domain-containing protein [Bacillota bacterium]MBR3374763.1 STAS domain-containing protein [Bacillota bacterium]